MHGSSILIGILFVSTALAVAACRTERARNSHPASVSVASEFG